MLFDGCTALNDTAFTTKRVECSRSRDCAAKAHDRDVSALTCHLFPAAGPACPG